MVRALVDTVIMFSVTLVCWFVVAGYLRLDPFTAEKLPPPPNCFDFTLKR